MVAEGGDPILCPRCEGDERAEHNGFGELCTGHSVITVWVEGGLVQNVEGVPAGYIVQVRDYDIDGLEADRLLEDDEGALYSLTSWRAS